MKRRYFNYRNVEFKQGIFVILIIMVFAMIVFITVNKVDRVSPAFAAVDDKITVIVDPGHGGEDGGAVGYDNVTIEKDLNLKVALKLRDFLTVGGYNVVMTRQDDTLINDEGLSTIKQRKTSDIKNRLKIIQEHPEAILISIHQNQFTQAKYSGTQIFYGKKNSDSEIFAQLMQKTFHEILQPQNNREIKKTDKEIYLLYHSEIPSIMVECGFLSNPEECQLLNQDEYQNQVAFAIYAGLSKYIENCKKGLA